MGPWTKNKYTDVTRGSVNQCKKLHLKVLNPRGSSFDSDILKRGALKKITTSQGLDYLATKMRQLDF